MILMISHDSHDILLYDHLACVGTGWPCVSGWTNPRLKNIEPKEKYSSIFGVMFFFIILIQDDQASKHDEKKPHGNKKSCRNPKKPLILSFPSPSTFSSSLPFRWSMAFASIPWPLFLAPFRPNSFTAIPRLAALEVITPVVVRGGILGCPRKLVNG